MTVEEIRKLIEIGEPVSYNGHILDQNLLKEMLAFSEKEERKYLRPKSPKGLLEHAMESAAERKYEMLTGEMMKDMLEKFQAEQEKELLFGTKGKAYPWTSEEAFRNPRLRVQPGVEVDIEDVPYDMEPQDYVEKVAKKIEETGVIFNPMRTPGAAHKVVHLDPSGNVSEKPVYYAAIDPWESDSIKELDLAHEKKALDLFKMYMSTGVAVVNPYRHSLTNEHPGE